MNESSLEPQPAALPESLKTFQGFEDFQIFVNHNDASWRMPYEWHEQLELFYVRSGRGQYYIDNNVYLFEPGDLFVIGNHELHKSQVVDNEPFEVLVVMFDPKLVQTVPPGEGGLNPLALFDKREPGFSHCLKVTEPLLSKLQFSFDRLQELYGSNDRYARPAITALLHYILLELMRAYEANTSYFRLENHASAQVKPVVAQAMAYIADYYTEDLRLNQIACHLGVNSSYLSRVFKQSMGFSLVEFITFKRIWRAKEMLLNSDLQITDIAHRIGYNNVTHFQWTFKKMFGMSPGQYRKFPRDTYHLNKY